MVALMEHFRAKGAGRESEWARQRRWFIKAKHEQQRREQMEERAEDSATALSAAATVASELQVKEFKIKLDTYDSATVTALMENQELLDAVNERLEAMLARAHVLEDGRRVFRTEDGTQVFDEHGVEVGVDEVHPDAIDPTKPTWEAFSAEVEQKDQLVQERTEIIEFQEKVDAARERVDAGEISEAELDELDADLLESLPNAVQEHVPGLEQHRGAVQSNDMGEARTESVMNGNSLVRAPPGLGS